MNPRDKTFYANYWQIIHPIWKDFFAEKISMKARDELLQPHRLRLHRIQQEMSKEANARALASA